MSFGAGLDVSVSFAAKSFAAKAVMATTVFIAALCIASGISILIVWVGVIGAIWLLGSLAAMMPGAATLVAILGVVLMLVLVMAAGIATGIGVLMPAVSLIERWYVPEIRRQKADQPLP